MQIIREVREEYIEPAAARMALAAATGISTSVVPPAPAFEPTMVEAAFRYLLVTPAPMGPAECLIG